MQAQVPDPQPTGARAGRTPSDENALIRSFEAIADAFAGGDDLFDAGCRALAHQACRLLGWTRCSIFLKNAETGAYAGRLNYRTDGAAIDSRVARLTCATTADRFAQELIATRRPVLIRDARNDPRPVRAAMSRWRVRTILGVPLTAGDEVVGLLFLDDEDTLRDYDARRMDLSARFERLAGVAVRHAARAAERGALVEVGLRQTENLRQQLAVQDRLMARVRDGATIWELARVAAALTGNP